MQAALIRKKFLEFFQARGHQAVPSASLVPADDPTLLFTNAGMVQFKRVFQGLETRDYRRAVSCQKCVRAGGKHNDLEQVGHTARHHTFFEMLGNFSFGDYFKKEAIEYAWEWVTGTGWLGIDPKRLYVTVHHTDDEARRLWREVTGIPDKRIYGLGDKDNFWQMADTGPAGPNTEIYVDLRGVGGWKKGKADLTLEEFVDLQEQGALLEIWNLVFMQYDLQKDGTRASLPAPSVDTGAGLERIAAVLQGVPSNFDTDVFAPVLKRAVEVVGRPYDRGPAGAPYRVLADHARAVAFLIADGVIPSNDGRGYVVRRILRRAVWHAWLLERREPTLVELTAAIVAQLGDVYPELVAHKANIERLTRAEEERFLETIGDGLKRMEELRGDRAISGADAFKLSDTYGMPIDLVQLIATERGQTVDLAGFERALEEQRERSRATHVLHAEAGRYDVLGSPAVLRAERTGAWVTVRPKGAQTWIGYETTHADTDIIQFRQSGDVVELVLEENPFYAESGGQVSDTGRVLGEGWALEVSEVEKVNGRSAVVGRFGERFEPTPVEAAVDERRRRDIERNHTATHLVHAALREVLGQHVRQAGSVVAPERLRFDFSHHGPIGEADLAAIEREVNAHVWENLPVETRESTYKEAIAAGAMALFGEKYGDVVRMVDIPGVSLELCGGTHVRSTGQIALFRFTHETGAAAGVRRIEAVTGPVAYAGVRDLERQLEEAAARLKTRPEHLTRRIDALLDQARRLDQQLAELVKGGAGGGAVGGEQREVVLPGEVTLVYGTTPLEQKDQIAASLDAFRSGRSGAVAVTLSPSTGAIYVALTDDLVKRGCNAGAIVKEIAAVSGGRGGGRAHFASGGVGDSATIPETLEQLPALVGKLVN